MHNLREFFETGFYRDPRPEVVVEAVREALNSNIRQANVIFGFSRACSQYPSVRAACLELASQLGDDERDFVESFAVMPSSRSIGSYITQPGDIDDLWSDFLATGHEAPVLSILTVIDWPDEIGRSLTDWKKSLAYDPAAEQAFGPIGEDIDYDIQCFLVAKQNRVTLAHIRFPMPLTEGHALSSAIKGLAWWSALAMAKKHQIALAVCRTPGGERISIGRRQLIAALAHVTVIN